MKFVGGIICKLDRIQLFGWFSLPEGIAFVIFVTLHETNIFAPENRPGPKRKLVFQPSIFRCYVSFREGICGICFSACSHRFDCFVHDLSFQQSVHRFGSDET